MSLPRRVDCQKSTKNDEKKQFSENDREQHLIRFRDVYAIKSPNKIALPAINMTSSFIFAKNDLFLAYPNNFNHYANYFKNTYQHGGISLEEMILPFVVLEPKN